MGDSCKKKVAMSSGWNVVFRCSVRYCVECYAELCCSRCRDGSFCRDFRVAEVHNTVTVRLTNRSLFTCRFDARSSSKAYSTNRTR